MAEKAARDRLERSLRDAQATIRDLEGRLDVAGQRVRAAQADLAAERQKAVETVRAAMMVQEVATPTGAAVPTVRRPVGRPRKTAVEQPVEIPKAPVTGKAKGSAKPGRAAQPRASKPINWWLSKR